MEILDIGIIEEKEIKESRLEKKTLTADDMTLYIYIKNTKDATRELIEPINEYSKVVSYKINTQKSLAFLYTKNEKPEREIK